MIKAIQRWLATKWMPQPPDLGESYRATFNNYHGQKVLNHLIDTVYCSVYEGKDPIELSAHNARRSVVHDILINLDAAESRWKYDPKLEGAYAAGSGDSQPNP